MQDMGKNGSNSSPLHRNLAKTIKDGNIRLFNDSTDKKDSSIDVTFEQIIARLHMHVSPCS
jgi:hypothetical protein